MMTPQQYVAPLIQLRVSRTCNLVSQRDDSEHADDADEDERGFDQARGDVAERHSSRVWSRREITTAVPMFAMISDNSSGGRARPDCRAQHPR